MKIFTTVILCFCLLISSLGLKIYAAGDSFSWYCKRVPGNAKPPLPTEFSFINDYSCIWLDNSENKKVYLTFDAGYENGNIEKILNVLKEKEVNGAFFILLNLIDSNPELVKRMKNDGHLVCNHTANHKNMSKIKEYGEFKSELDKLSDAYYDLTGSEIAKYYRPPEGCFSELNLKYAQESGYKTVFWSFAYADWDNSAQPSRDYAKKKILDNVHDGAVLLLHPTSATNAAIMSELIDELKSSGYEFGTLDEIG